MNPNGKIREQNARELTLEKKVKLLEEIKAGATQRALARKYGVSRTTIGNIYKKREAILKTWKINNSGERKRILRKTANDMINTLMWQYIQNNNSQNIPISGPLLKIKALEIAKTLKIETFKASKGWLRSFLKGRNIDPRTFLVNSDQVNKDDEEINKNKECEEMNLMVKQEEVNESEELTFESDKLAQSCLEPVVKIKPGNGHPLDIDIKDEQLDDDEDDIYKDDEEEVEEVTPTHQEALHYAEHLLRYANVHKPDLLPKLCEIYNSVEEICKANHGELTNV